MTRVCYHYWIQGRVQGVFFRAFTEKTAQTMGLDGWVKNLSDGRVEVLACGQRETLEKFEILLRSGPPRAHVERIERREEPQIPCDPGFRRLA